MVSIFFLIIGYFITFFVLLAPILYILLLNKYDYWKAKNVEGPQPTLLLGNMKELFTIKHHLGAHFKYVYEKTKHLPFAGIYLFHRPAIIVNNIDLIKAILVKDFIHFTDHGFYFDKKTQPVANHLFNINGAKWKGTRAKLSPAFTPNKLKQMFGNVAACGEELIKYLESFSDSEQDVDIKDAVAKFTTDVIVSCAFGIDSNSFKYPDAEFREIGKAVFEVTKMRKIKVFIALFIPELHKIINGKLLTKKVSDFFINMIAKTVKHREENNITKNDLLQFLMQLRKKENIDDHEDKLNDSVEAKENEILDVQLNMKEITAQAFGFFAGGFETASTTSGFMFYELAKHPEIQAKVTEEIDKVLRKYDGKICYESLNEMSYIDQVIEETLRLYPPIPQLFRICTKNYVLPNTNILIEKGTPVVISTLGIQNDPYLYSKPEKFDPDRFSPENKASRSNCSFLSFGEGPRICIGMPLAMIQLRVVLVSVLRHYEVSIGSKKEKTLEVINKSLLMTPKDMMLKINKRRK